MDSVNNDSISTNVFVVTLHAQRKRGKIIGVGVHIYIYVCGPKQILNLTIQWSRSRGGGQLPAIFLVGNNAPPPPPPQYFNVLPMS